MTDILYIPVAWAIYVRDDQTDWRRYSMHDYLPVAERAVERMSGPPLQFQIVPLYHDPRAFTEDELTKLRAERDDAIRHLADWSSRCGRTETDLAAARALLALAQPYTSHSRLYDEIDAALAGKDAT